MSDQSFIKTPRQLIWVVVLAFVVPVIVIILLVRYVTSESRTGAGSDAMTPEAIEQRVMPVGGFKFADSVGAAKAGARSGEDLYKASCISCHGSGAAGAPKFGDAAAWGPRIAKGLDGLMKTVETGKNAMPVKGGVADATDFELRRAVVYMTNHSGGSLKEPEPPKDAAAPTPAKKG